MTQENKTFRIGLCMAGAISAGAYTAGVLDYLLEALEEWQKRKDRGEVNIPDHHVEIPIIGGASAGGMTGIITAAAIHDELTPVSKLGSNILAPVPGNRFYHSWVDLISEDMLTVMLNTADIEKKVLYSALNSDFIDQIADRAFKVSNNPPVARNYFAENLKVFVTLSNLEGMDFSVTFRSNSPKLNRYIISSHNDYACFMLCNKEADYKNDGWIPLNFRTLLNTGVAKDAAMATGAFPVGLKARKVVRDGKYLNDLDWFKPITRDAQHPFPSKPYETVNVDGGMINNEPFENVRKILSGITNQNDSKDFQNYDRFKSTVLMIDPFPSELGAFNASTELSTIIGNTLGAVIGQSRVKPTILIDTMDSNKAGQFLIAPVRYQNKDGKEMFYEGKYAIACGSLDGFSGFISKEFRIHDYFLGRANCEKFLRDHFTVPANTKNEIFVAGYANVKDKTPFTSSSDGGWQIIPLFTPRQSKGYMPVFSNGKEWPSIKESEIIAYRRLIKARIEKVLLNVSEYSQPQRLLVSAVAKLFLNGKIADAVINTIIKSLGEHQLIDK